MKTRFTKTGSIAVLPVLPVLPVLAAIAMLAPLALSAADKGIDYIVLDKSAGRAALPFSDAVLAGNTLYVAGTLGLDPKTFDDMKTAHVPDDPAAEARFAMEAVKHTVEAAGFSMDDFVSVQVFCTDLTLYGAFNDIYRTYFNDHFPARAFIGVDKLVRGARFEIMGTAVKGTAAKGAPAKGAAVKGTH